MRFELDEDRALLKSSTRELLERESPLAAGRTLMEGPEGFSAKLYEQLGELGYLGLSLPESKGGAGVGVIGLAAVLHEAGRVALPGPLLDLVLAGEALHHAGGAVADHWLGDLVAGRKRVLLARRETVSGLEPATAATRLAGGRVLGTKTFVPFGAAADALLVTTAEGLALVERPAQGFCATALPTLDHAQRFVEIALDLPGALVAGPAAATELLRAVDRLAAVGAAAMLLGLMERALELSVAYLKDRKAFGVPIGSFQSLQHRASEMLLQVESARSAVYRAAWACDHDPAQAALLAATAKAYCGDAGRFVCGEAIQIFGGVGYTWEYDPHIYWKRVKTLEQFYGSTRSQLEAVLEASGV
jgi:alkylation response protein AidB-like acyl-CoA dehydrogenase